MEKDNLILDLQSNMCHYSNMNMENITKYKTAFSPLFGVYVVIDKIRQDSNGEYILHCSSNYNPNCILTNHLFRVDELNNFCL